MAIQIPQVALNLDAPLQAQRRFVEQAAQGGSDVANFLMEARRRERERESEQARLLLDKQRYADLQARQRRQDYEAALVKASELAAAGNHDAARSVLAPFVSGMQDIEKERPLPLRLDLNQAQPPALSAAPPPSMPPADPQMGLAQPIDSEDPSRTLAPSPMQPQPPAPQAPAANPLVEARQREIQADQVRARKLLAFMDPNGQRVTIDPMQGEIAQRERREAMQRQNLETFDQVVTATNDPTVARYAAELRPAIGMSADPIRPQDVLNYIRNRADRAEDLRFREEDKNEQRRFQTERDRFLAEEAMKRARLRGSGGGSRPVTPAQAADDARANAGAWGTQYDRWEKGANVDKLTDAYDKFSELSSAASHYKQSGDIVNQRNALYQTARYITGPGVLTPQEYDNTVQRTAGWSAALRSKVEKGLTGDISPEEWSAIDKFVANANATIKAKASRAVKNFDARHANSYYTRTVPDEVNGSRQALIDRFGLTEQEVGAPPWMQPQQGRGAAAAPATNDPSVKALIDKLYQARRKGAAGGR